MPNHWMAVSTSLSPRPERLTRISAGSPSGRAGSRRAEPHGAGQAVRGLDGGQDALGLGQQREGLHGLGVGDGLVVRPAGRGQVGVLGADARVVQAGGDRVRLLGLAVGVLQHEGAHAVQHAHLAGGDGRGVPAGLQAVAAGLEAVQGDVGVGDEVGEDAEGVRAAADAGRDGVRQPAVALQHLGAGLGADDPLELPDQHRERVRARDGADEVVGVVDGGDPVAHRVVHRVLERLGARLDGDHLGAEQPHPGDVQRLPLGVDLAHVDGAAEPEEGRGGRGGHAVLAGAGLGDDAGLAHPPGQQRLAEDVVDLVRAGVVEVLALEQDARGRAVLGRAGGREAVRLGQRRRAARVVLRAGASSSAWKSGSTIAARNSCLELAQRGVERLGDELAAELLEVAAGVGVPERLLQPARRAVGGVAGGGRGG